MKIPVKTHPTFKWHIILPLGLAAWVIMFGVGYGASTLITAL